MKKLVSWLLLLCILNTLFSFGVLAAEETYVYDFNKEAGAKWKSNSDRVLNRDYTVSIDGGSPQTFSMWILTNNIGEPLQVYSPTINLDTAACSSAELSFTCWHNEKSSGPDPDLNIKIYYSTDNGFTWENELPITVTDTGKVAICDQDISVKGKVYTVTTSNICEVVKNKVITNLKIIPFDGVYAVGAFRITDLYIVTTGAEVIMNQYVPTFNDSPVIQKMIDEAPSGSEVTIGINPRTGDRNWEIGQAIHLPSDITVYIDDAILRLADDVFCNIFYSETAYAETLTAEEEQKNIRIIGKGNAVLDGGNHNGQTESTAGYPDIVQNTFIFFRNVDGFEVKNLTMKNSRWWASTFIFCENGIVEDIIFDARNTAPNQDGIDLRIGCNNIKINNITGVTGDDTVALTALLHKFDTRWLVEGKDTNIHHINITNIRALCSGAHGVIRLLAQDGNKVQDITIDTVYDMSIDKGGPRCKQGLLRIGESGYSTVKQNEPGDIDRVTVSNVTSRANSAVYVGTANVSWDNLTIRNIKAVEGTVVGGKISLKDMPVAPTLNGEPSAWAKEEIFKALEADLVPEHVNSNYTTDITRSDFCDLIIKMIEKKSSKAIADVIAGYADAKADVSFPDTDSANVIAAAKLGIVNGRSSGAFDPTANITRQEAAKMLALAAKVLGADITASEVAFADADDIYAWAKEFIYYVNTIGVMNGTSTTTPPNFSPLRTYTREQSILTVYRLWGAL